MAEKMIKKVTVKKEDLASYVGSGTLDVLATPSVIAFMEGAAAELAQKTLNSSELTTVGTAINIEHFSPTPLGAEVVIEASLVKTDGRFYEFDVSARDKAGEIAKGSHTRVSVKAEKFQKKADSKFDEI
jgi:predicted thioesterase